MKSARQSKILEIIENKDIETQEELAEELRSHGVNVTQATVSRDIKEMRLLKVLSENGGYKYATAERSEKGLNDRLNRIFAESVMSVSCAGNLIVLRTLSGSANAAAETIDNLHWPELLGSIAGDNTIFVAVSDEANVQSIAARFRAMCK